MVGHGDRLRCVHVIPTNLGKVSNISRRVRSSPDVGPPIVCGDGRTRNWGSATANALSMWARPGVESTACLGNYSQC